MQTVERLLLGLTDMVNELGHGSGAAREIRRCTIVEPSDVSISSTTDRSDEAVLLIGSAPDELAMTLKILARSTPALVLAKAPAAASLARMSADAGIAHVACVNADVSWGQLHSLVERLIASEMSEEGILTDVSGDEHLSGDLFSVANSLADQIGGYVSIDDAQHRVLAFSPLDEHADELRRVSILGGTARREHGDLLRTQGVWERLKRAGQIVELERNGDTMARLAIGIVDDRTQAYLGTIWVQQGIVPFAANATQILNAGATLAARAILRADRIESMQSKLALQLLGLRRATEPPRELAAQLGLAETRTWTIAGFQVAHDGTAALSRTAAATLLNLHAIALRKDARVSIAAGRAYVLFPDPPQLAVIVAWADRTGEALGARVGLPVSVAIGPIVDRPKDVPNARRSVDLLLQDMAFREEIGVATFESRRARLHVARALRLMWDKGVLDGASVTAILDTKYVDGRQLLNTLRAYIEGGGRIQHVAQALHLHPNTLRQRLRRIESVTGFSLNDPDERLLLELQYRAYIENETR